MSDISQIQVNGTTYDLCDATSRTQIANLQDSVPQVITVSTNYTIAANSTIGLSFNPTIPSGYTVAGFVAARTYSANTWIGQFGKGDNGQPIIAIYSTGAVTNGYCEVNLLLVPNNYIIN